MREHLFRGKREDGKWVEGCLVKDSQHTSIRDFGYEYHGVIPDSVQEYTGKNIPKSDIKIFEGDVIAMESMMNSEKYYVVTWNDSKCAFELRGLKNNRMRFDMEIIDAISDVQIVGNNLEPLEDLK